MVGQKTSKMKFMILGLILLTFLPGFQVIKEESVSVSGRIGSIDKNGQSISLGGKKYSISPATTIVDEKGNKLRIDDLNPGLFVTIESVCYSSGFWAKKIIIQKVNAPEGDGPRRKK